jgi:hypothetical protein
MTVSLAYNGAGLGTVWGEDTVLSMLADAGIARVDVHQLPHDIVNTGYITWKSSSYMSTGHGMDRSCDVQAHAVRDARHYLLKGGLYVYIG